MTNKIIASALRSNGYYLDAANNILYMTAPYEKKSNIYGTTEYKNVCNILAQFPDVQFSIQKKAAKRTVTYEMMEEFIKIMSDSVDMLEEFKRVKLMSHAYSSAYKYVENWFNKKYPAYSECMATDKDGNPKWDMVELYKKAEEKKAQKAAEASADQDEEDTPAKPKLTLLENAG